MVLRSAGLFRSFVILQLVNCTKFMHINRICDVWLSMTNLSHKNPKFQIQCHFFLFSIHFFCVVLALAFVVFIHFFGSVFGLHVCICGNPSYLFACGFILNIVIGIKRHNTIRYIQFVFPILSYSIHTFNIHTFTICNLWIGLMLVLDLLNNAITIPFIHEWHINNLSLVVLQITCTLYMTVCMIVCMIV